ncbi:anhydro-N-acetylmuramic acid kinase [Cocleimonas sp. KMM 6892]|uniref:anhydro-N-acetylmuramic acid kinase n=1 Tax=unclassified Cocleimonas TaxID=2639732 RepID=UPI002DB99E23|nr:MULTISPECIES: anhydro-N-acetylmuramic acid kinase [unclassified Cocleimonas]MEB8431689.1 anhydro-N-acetylmuramic acid kinase [Cocleimonas sp. KMM 6892]MEC4713539.1 anhydro-N-acetylmuramic acid kinase [Cocleimonas sp. KMM 6895]MEC4742870.1 anhydro-N-acetylmuramic acid kinase [Cocleimonas sp. KMM 6896]
MAKIDYYIGLMSGTSLDGVDTVLVGFDQLKPTLIASYVHPIESNLRETLLETIHPEWKGTLVDIGTLNQKLGRLFADASCALIKDNNIDKNTITAIGSHGQTLWHQPLGEHPFSLQLGDASIIAEQTGITTIADFRSRDIAAGGQGAPLVPAFHKELLSHPDKNRVILNVGGISNITILPSSTSPLMASGFDTGPGNGLLDAWISKHKTSSYDKNGDWAKSGSINETLLELLLSEPYFALPSPKSTGKELFNLTWLENFIGDQLHQEKPEDIQATLTELTAKSISDNVIDCDELYICGGGTHNSYLIERLKHHLPDTVIDSTAKLGIDPDWMEAMAFAWLAKQAHENKTGNLPLVTGASGERILGAIYPA